MPLFPLTGNAIRAFGYGSEAPLPVTEPLPTFLPPAQPPILAKPGPSLHGNALQPIDSACMFSTCANLQVSGSFHVDVYTVQFSILCRDMDYAFEYG